MGIPNHSGRNIPGVGRRCALMQPVMCHRLFAPDRGQFAAGAVCDFSSVINGLPDQRPQGAEVGHVFRDPAQKGMVVGDSHQRPAHPIGGLDGGGDLP